MNKTFMANNQTVQHNWYVVDAANKPLGRLASEVAEVLTGKNKPIYTPTTNVSQTYTFHYYVSAFY